MLVDLKGRLTLGELYVDALMDKFKDVEVVKKYCTLATLDTTVVADLGRLTKLTYSTWGREKSYHNKNFFYQRQFAKGNGRALIGYSESLYTVLDQINNSFAKEEKPFDPANIGIKEIALSDNGSTPIGWVDALGLDAKLSGAKLMDATAFVNFCTSPEGYRLALKPDYGDAPRYLLPAFRRCFEDQEIIVAAPMYKMLLPLAERIVSVTNDGISPALMEIGAAIDALNLKAK